MFAAQVPTSIQGKLLVYGEWLTEALPHVEPAEQAFHKKKPVHVYKFRACCLTRAPMCAWGGVAPWFVPVLLLPVTPDKWSRAELQHEPAWLQARDQIAQK